jgi:hypothetical protein
MRSITPLVAAIAAVALTGCTGDDPETQTDVAATTETGKTALTQEPTAESEPEVFRESIGLFRATDPATAELAELLDTGHVALDLTLFIGDENVETTASVDGAAGSVNVWFFFDASENGFLTLNVPEAALAVGDVEKQDYLSALRGVFSVEASSGSDVDFVLTLIGDVPESETTDEQRCSTEEEALMSDVETLLDHPEAYATIREHWMDSPRLWWAVKATAHSLAEYGDVSDSVATACAIYW